MAEQAKFYLMKQVVLIKWTLDSLDRLKTSPETVHRYGFIQAPPIRELAKKTLEGKFDLSLPENSLKHLKVLLNQVLDNSESSEFHNTVNILSCPH